MPKPKTPADEFSRIGFHSWLCARNSLPTRSSSKLAARSETVVEVGRSAAYAPSTVELRGLDSMWVGRLQRRQSSGALYRDCIPNPAALSHLGRLAHGTRITGGGNKRSAGRSEVGVSKRTLPGLRLGGARLLHGSKSRHGGHAAGARSGTGSHADHPT